MASEASLGLSWNDSNWIPTALNAANILDYFSERSNPFYDRTCNNEVVKMQRLNPEQLNNMVGLEYIVLHAQEPILYIIRKQNRVAPDHVVPLTDYYIIGGKVYQAPDVSSVLNSRLLNTVHMLQSAFEQAQSYSRYHPSKGYSWEFKDKEQTEQASTKEKKKDESSSVFQRQRVDILLGELSRKFPPKIAAVPVHEKTEEVKEVDVKTETPDERNPTAFQNGGKPPPEKKPKLMR